LIYETARQPLASQTAYSFPVPLDYHRIFFRSLQSARVRERSTIVVVGDSAVGRIDVLAA
jgi:hypothetical protein